MWSSVKSCPARLDDMVTVKLLFSTTAPVGWTQAIPDQNSFGCPPLQLSLTLRAGLSEYHQCQGALRYQCTSGPRGSMRLMCWCTFAPMCTPGYKWLIRVEKNIVLFFVVNTWLLMYLMTVFSAFTYINQAKLYELVFY